MEENNDISLGSSDVLVHLAGPMHKNISQHFFGAIYLAGTYLMTYFLTHLPLVHIRVHLE